MKIAVCVIAKNEARCIQRCLKSVAGIASELLVADTGSTDDTVALARKAGARVVSIPWEDDFAKAKNAALAEVEGADWVIFPDADEWFEPGVARRLEQLLAKHQADPTVQTLSMRLYNHLREGEAPGFVPVVRVLRGNIGLRYHGAVHEALLTPEGQPPQTRMAPPDQVSLQHDGYAGKRGREKPQRNIRLLRKMQEDGNTDPLLDYYLGTSLVGTRAYAEALPHLRRFLEASPDSHGPVVLSAMLDAERALRRLGAALPDADAQRRWLAEDALRRYPKHPTARLIAANARFEAGDAAGALPLYEEAVKLRKGFDAAAERSENLAEAAWPGVWLRIALAKAEADPAAARQACEESLKLAPASAEAVALWLACAGPLPAEEAGRALLAFIDAGAPLNDCLWAVWRHRADIAFLLVYDRYIQAHPGAVRDVRFTTMQAALGQVDIAADDVAGRITGHPLWCGSFTQSFAAAPPTQMRDLQLALAEATAAALCTQAVPALQGLLPVAPPALADAIRLCLGEDLATLHPEGLALLPLVGERLAPLGAPPEIATLWSEVLHAFEQ